MGRNLIGRGEKEFLHIIQNRCLTPNDKKRYGMLRYGTTGQSPVNSCFFRLLLGLLGVCGMRGDGWFKQPHLARVRLIRL